MTSSRLKCGEGDRQIHFPMEEFVSWMSTGERIQWQKRMKCNVRNRMTALCCVPDETPMGFNLKLQQKLFGRESISTERDEKRNETNQRLRLGRCSR